MSGAAAQTGGKRRWTKERREMLARLWPDPEIATDDLAARLGVTAAAARCAALRLGLRQTDNRFGPRAARVKLVLRPRRAMMVNAAAIDASAASGADRQARCCAPMWDEATPASERRYCDAAVAGRALYCESHRAALLVTPRRKRRTAP